MAYDIISNPWSFPSRLSSILEENEDLGLSTMPSGISISEDDKNIYVEASVPGVDPNDIDVTFQKGTLWIRGDTKREEDKKKYYRRAINSFSYRVAVPGDIDQSIEPEATYKNGVMTVRFAKSAKEMPKKIAVKSVK